MQQPANIFDIVAFVTSTPVMHTVTCSLSILDQLLFLVRQCTVPVHEQD